MVPGVPAGIAVPGYAGIPITYPGGGDTVTFIRGHEDDGKAPASIDWTSLARLDGTLVCYAGPQQLPEMLRALLAHGRSPDDSAAVIYDGTRPTQETIAGTLREIAATVGAARRPPAGHCSSSDASSRCASTCAGSTHGRCSASASW